MSPFDRAYMTSY